MTNVFQQTFGELTKPTMTISSSNRPLIRLGVLCIALCAFYIISIRTMEASEYALRNAVNSRDDAIKQYGDLGKHLDSLRSLSVISQAPILVGFQEVQKPSYLNMDANQSVAVAKTAH